MPLDPFHPPSQDGHRFLIPEGRKTDGSVGESFAPACKRSDTSGPPLASHLAGVHPALPQRPEGLLGGQRSAALRRSRRDRTALGRKSVSSVIRLLETGTKPALPPRSQAPATHTASATATPSTTRTERQAGWRCATCKLFGKSFKVSYVILNPLKRPTSHQPP